MKKIWQLASPDENAVKQLQSSLNCHPAIASVLVSRGIFSLKDANRFLNPTLQHLRPPFAIKDLDKAASRICRAIINKENLMIFGDYDADGVTATTLLYQFLDHAGASVIYHLPHRVREGYGLKPSHISKLAIPNRISLIVTVDCGSSDHDAVTLAHEKGIDVIITDHHEPPSVLPPALAFVNPKRQDCHAGFEILAGVGVAFYLVVAIRRFLRDAGYWELRKEPNLKKACDLVALGTVADMVPMTGENRVLTKIGLDILRSLHRCGLDALMQSIAIDKSSVTAEDLAYKIAPRINAAGRIEHAAIAARLLTTADDFHALRAAEQLNRLNAYRQKEEKKILDTILNLVAKDPAVLLSKCLVLCGKGWHEGILGIIAARLTAIYYKPVILISLDNNVGKGSGRSISGFNLYKALAECSDLLLQFGGHAMAAGIQVEKKNIDLFRERILKVCIEMTGVEDFIPVISIDHQMNLDQITPDLADQVEMIGPFGNQNAEPVFMSRDVRVTTSSIVGASHRRMTVSPASDHSGFRLAAIQFNADAASLSQSFFAKMAYKVQWNRWNGKKNLQLIVEEIDTSI